ncbi:hypothetical protein [[Clostridium] aminophilum]|uniref:hypothetical protein n=1 Tax=[Clostridium] aminophilum TaxID=1526 RepID=UPI00332D93CC
MKKRFAAGILAASYLTVTSVTPVLAETGQTTIINDTSRTIPEDVSSDGTYGVLVVADEQGTGAMDVQVNGDVNVDIDELQTAESCVAGVAVQNERQDANSDITVTVDGSIDLYNGADMFSPEGVALKTDNYSNSAVTVTTGAISSYSEIHENNPTGIHSTAISGKTNITVNGKVKAVYAGDSDNTDEDDKTSTMGLISDTRNQQPNSSASSAITINGDLIADSAKALAEGGYLFAQGAGASSELTVTGSVRANSDESGANGLEVASVNGMVRADIKKDIIATGELGANGILTYLDGTNSLTEINVDGSITAKGKDATAILINQMNPPEECTDSKSTVSIRAGGDVNSSSYGVVDLDQTNGGQTNVLIEGTLVSEGPAVVVLKESAENLNLTVWKIETKNEHIAVEDHMESPAEYSSIAKKAEESIQYILKVENTQENLISLDQTKTQTWSNADGTTSNYHVAHEKERVAVKLNVPNGYKVDKAYNDAEKTTDLCRDENGSYYLIVPKGGGVWISVSLVPDDSTDDNGSGNGNSEHNNDIYDDSGSDDGDDGYAGTEPTPAAEVKAAATEPVILAADANGTAAINLKHINVTEGIASIIFSENLSNASISADTLTGLLNTGANELKISTSAGKFSIPCEKLKELAAQYTNLRFVVNGNQLMIYADNPEIPVLILEASVISNLTVN